MMYAEGSTLKEIDTSRWVRIARCEEIPEREGRTAFVDGREIAIFKLGDRFLALDNRCPHRGGPLADGLVAGHTVVCPLHAWKVNLETGTVERPAGTSPCIRQYATRVEGDLVAIAYPH
jgi:nitrite reductase (NADH) small subunit